MYGYTICDSCKSKLGLFRDETIKRYGKNLGKEVERRLDLLERDYKKKRIKLLYIKERLKRIR